MARVGLWTDFGTCLQCKRDYNVNTCLPISLDCGHTLCKPCLIRLHREQKLCPFDSKDRITSATLQLPVNVALLAATDDLQPSQLYCELLQDSTEQCFSCTTDRDLFMECSRILEKFSPHLRSSKSTGTTEMSSCAYINTTGVVTLSRPMQKKLLSLVTCQVATEAGRERLARCVRSLGERCITEMILQHQHPHQLSGNLWGAVRSRGCQFLGPAMQEEVIRLVLMALEDGSALSRKVLVLFVVQRLHEKYPQASKTAIGHVVQLLYRASCFKVMKRDNESSLMQLKEEYCKYEHLRYEHDKQIVQIAHEAGLRIAPDQWSSLLYGDMYHKSKMQSIIDKLQTPQSFKLSISEFRIALGRTNDPAKLSCLETPLLQVANLTEVSPASLSIALQSLQAIEAVLDALTEFVRDQCHDKLNFGQIAHTKYKTSVCRDFKTKGACPRGSACSFAHNDDDEGDRGGDYPTEEADDTEHTIVLKPRAVVSPTTRNRSPLDVQWQSRPLTLHPNIDMYANREMHAHRDTYPRELQPTREMHAPRDFTQSGYYQHVGPPNEMSPAELVMPPQIGGYYHQMAVAPPMMTRLPPHPAMHMLPPSPLSPPGYMSMAGGDVTLVPARPYHQYYPQQPVNYYNYYEQSQYPAPHSPRSPYTPQMAEEPYYEQRHAVPAHLYQPLDHPAFHRAPAPSNQPHSAHRPHTQPPVHSPESQQGSEANEEPAVDVTVESSSVMANDILAADQENLYEYHSRPSDGTLQTLASLRRRRDELLDKIQSHQRPTEVDDTMKTEISRDRIEDLARSLAVSMNVGAQEADLQATYVNSMLSAANMAPLSTACSEEASKAGNWWPEDSDIVRPSTLFDSLSGSGVGRHHPSVSEDAEDNPVWTSLSGLTSSVGQVIKEYRVLRRSMSEKEGPSEPLHPTPKFNRSSSHSATESSEPIPWSDRPFISKFGPISRSANTFTGKVEMVWPEVAPAPQPPLSTELDTEVKDKLPIQVSTRNNDTMTAVTRVTRPIPSPSLAHSKFTALPDDQHGFTVTNAHMEGSSSIAESEQLRQELKILTSKIDKVEAQAACEELTDLERSIQRLEASSSNS